MRGLELRKGFSLALFLLSGCSGSRGTIGAVLAKTQDGKVFVRDTPEGLAARKAGLLAGDEILLIDGLGARDLSPEQLRATLAGEVGDPVKLTVIREQQVIRLTLRRTPAQRLPSQPPVQR